MVAAVLLSAEALDEGGAETPARGNADADDAGREAAFAASAATIRLIAANVSSHTAGIPLLLLLLEDDAPAGDAAVEAEPLAVDEAGLAAVTSAAASSPA